MAEDLRQKIIDVIDNGKLASVATVKDGKPWVRYMAFGRSGDGLELFSATFANSRKVLQVKNDKNIHLTFGGDSTNCMKPYINVVGTAEILDDDGAKNAVWCDELANYFQGPDDPNYVVLKVSPETIEYSDPTTGPQPEVFNV
jgi:general stress protein 26